MARKSQRPPPRQKSRLPLNDPRWRPLIAEHKRLAERDGDPYLAARDLTEALTSSKLRCLGRRRANHWAREPVPSAFWADYELRYWSDGLTVSLRAHRRGRIILPLRGVVFSIWRPDVDRLWPGAPDQQPQQAETPARRKPGPRPTKNWPLHVAGELHRIVIERGKPAPPAPYFVGYCRDKLGYVPEIRAVQRLLKQLSG